MTGARLRSTRSAWPCAGQAVSHSPHKRAVLATVSGADDRPLIQSRIGEQLRQAERGRRQGSLPVRAGTLGPGPEGTRARPEGVALHLTHSEALILERLLKRHMKALNSSVRFWRREISFGQQPSFDINHREREAELMQRLYLALFDVNKQNPKSILNQSDAYKTAKTSE